MITIYTTPTCAFCHAAKQYFKSKGAEYREVDLSHEPNAAQILLDKSGQLGVPVIDIDGQIIVGFDRNRIDLMLRDKNLLK